MKITVIGAAGTVGSAISQWFREMGHEVIDIDLDNQSRLIPALEEADLVFVAILPTEAVPEMLQLASEHMRPNTLLVHGTSIENPGINPDRITGTGVGLCHLHLHFLPHKPLVRTLDGQPVSVSFYNATSTWQTWVIDQFRTTGARLYQFEPNQHDHITKVSQLIHMLVATTVFGVWNQLSPEEVQAGLLLGGPPSGLLNDSIIRTAMSARVIEGILLNHPHTIATIDACISVLQQVKSAVSKKEESTIRSLLTEGRNRFDITKLQKIDEITAEMVRIKNSLQKGYYTFHIPVDQSHSRILNDLYVTLERYNLDTTLAITQKHHDGSHTLTLSFEQESETTLVILEELCSRHNLVFSPKR